MQANASYYYRQETATAVANATQAFDFVDPVRWIQIAVVPSAAYSAGILTLQFKPLGLNSWVNYYDSTGSAVTISLASPKPLILENFAVQDIRFVPSAITDTTYTYDISVVAISDNARLAD